MNNITTDDVRCAICKNYSIPVDAADFGGIVTCMECGRSICIAHSIAPNRRHEDRRICADCLPPAENTYHDDYDFLADACMGDLADIEANDEMYNLL